MNNQNISPRAKLEGCRRQNQPWRLHFHKFQNHSSSHPGRGDEEKWFGWSNAWIGGSVGAGVVGAGVEGTVKRHETSMNTRYMAKIWGQVLVWGKLPVGGTVVGVVSGLGAASLGVTKHKITDRMILWCNLQSQVEDKNLISSSAMSALAAPPRCPGKWREWGITYQVNRIVLNILWYRQLSVTPAASLGTEWDWGWSHQGGWALQWPPVSPPASKQSLYCHLIHQAAAPLRLQWDCQT